MMMSFFLVFGCAANPFLDASSDQPVSTKFRGTEWSDDIGQEDIAVTARVVTTRIAKMPWGAIFKVEFTDLESRADKPREIRPDYFIVTDDRIVLLNEQDNDAAAKKISALDKRPDSNRTTFTALTPAASNTTRGNGKLQSN
jgi:hypothetical protein